MPSYKLRTQLGPFDNTYHYRRVGEEYLGYIKNFCNLKPNEDVLDIGCGCGQVAILLTEYLNKDSVYEGFDIVKSFINWCKENITSRYPNFHFNWVNIFNKRYNPNGKDKASEYKFPYRDRSFDFVLIKSVFTHMLPQDMENYMSEICRVLKKGGRCLISYFLLNEESLRIIKAKSNAADFKHIFKNYCTIDKKNSEKAIAYNEIYIQKLYKKTRLEIKEVHYGSWPICARKNLRGYQDIIIASK